MESMIIFVVMKPTIEIDLLSHNEADCLIYTYSYRVKVYIGF